VSQDIVWQPGRMAEEGIATMSDGLGDGRETGGGCGDLIVLDKLVPFDLQQLSLALHVESLKGTLVDREPERGESRFQLHITKSTALVRGRCEFW